MMEHSTGMFGSRSRTREIEFIEPDYVAFSILIAVAGIVATRNRIRILVPSYVLWFALLGAAIFFHHRSLAVRPVSTHGVIRPPIHSAVGTLAPPRLLG